MEDGERGCVHVLNTCHGGLWCTHPQTIRFVCATSVERVSKPFLGGGSVPYHAHANMTCKIFKRISLDLKRLGNRPVLLLPHPATP